MKGVRAVLGLLLLLAGVLQPRLLLSPLFDALALAWLAWASASAGWRRLSAVAGCGAAVMLLLMTPAAANTLLRLVEAEPTPAPCAGEADRFHVLLAGGTARAPLDDADFGALSADSLARTGRFARQFGSAPVTRLAVVSGGGRPEPEGRLMAALLERAGWPRAQLQLETGSVDTWTSAAEVRRLYGGRGSRIVLSTSALHLPRAVLAYRAHGFDVCANPLFSDFVAAGPAASFVPQAGALAKTESVVHELVGMAYYRLRRPGR